MKKKKISHTLFALVALALLGCSGGGDDSAEEQPDTVKPTLSCPETINIVIDAGLTGTEVTYVTPLGTDNSASPVTTQSAGLASGQLFPIGTTTNSFLVTDASGNTNTCSFDVVVSVPSENEPYKLSGGVDTPTGKKWSKVEDLSDEFNGTSFDDEKWHRNPASDGFGWYGRPPALFESKNVSVSDGNMNVTVEEMASPKNVSGNNYTHGGSIVRSKMTAKPGMYYECRMQANKTVMSSTFWIAFKQNCSSGPVRKLELDIQECVGRFSGSADWAVDYANAFASNTWRHARPCDVSVSVQRPGKTVLTEKNNSRFFVYACWWKSPTEMLFYLDGVYTHSITPATDFDIEGHITMAIETYDWNPIDAENIFSTGSVDDRSTKYDWIRTWELEDE